MQYACDNVPIQHPLIPINECKESFLGRCAPLEQGAPYFDFYAQSIIQTNRCRPKSETGHDKKISSATH